MRRWTGFFLGSPRRAVITLSFLAILGAIHHFAPGTLSTIANGVVGELSPLLSMLFYYGLVFFFIFLGLRTMFRPFCRERGARR